MPAGKSIGINRDYQILVRDILLKEHLVLEPYGGDGIDVPFDVKNTRITIDVVLQDDANRIVLVECKRWSNAVNRKELAAFSSDVEILRKFTGQDIAALFFAKSGFQKGSITSANELYGVEVVICDEHQPLHSYSLSYLGYDSNRQRRIASGKASLEGIATVSGKLFLRKISADGSVSNEIEID